MPGNLRGGRQKLSHGLSQPPTLESVMTRKKRVFQLKILPRRPECQQFGAISLPARLIPLNKKYFLWLPRLNPYNSDYFGVFCFFFFYGNIEMLPIFVNTEIITNIEITQS